MQHGENSPIMKIAKRSASERWVFKRAGGAKLLCSSHSLVARKATNKCLIQTTSDKHAYETTKNDCQRKEHPTEYMETFRAPCYVDN